MTLLEGLVALVLLVGLVGIVVPLLPGSLLIGGGILVWALATGGGRAWLALGVALAVLLAGGLLRYALPGRRLRNSGVPTTTLWAGAGLGLVGFFVVPVVGLVLGFVIGIYLAERARLTENAWPSTKAALRAVGLSILVELAAGLLAAAAWVAGVVAT